MSGPVTIETSPEAPVAPDAVRLRLRERAGGDNGYVDGAWWPRTRDLSAELPALLARVGEEVGPVERVAYGLTEWDPVAHRRLAGSATRVSIEGFRSIEPDTVWLVIRGRGRSRLGLMVVPHGTPQERAEALLDAADGTGDRRSPSQVLAAGDRS